MKKRILFAAAFIVLLSLGTITGYVSSALLTTEKAIKRSYIPIRRTTQTVHTTDPKILARMLQPNQVAIEKPFSILMLGVDERDGDRGRSDAIFVASVNPKTKKTVLFNIPRDTKSELVGRNAQDKLNHAYAYGGIEMAVQSIEKFINFPIDYYVKVNMEGFRQIIDTFGGIEVDSKQAFVFEGVKIKQGIQTLSGSEALAYTRMRYEDRRGDLGRNERQREVISNTFKKAISLKTIQQAPELLEKLGSYMQTNMTFENIKKLGTHYYEALKNINTTEIKGSGTKERGIYYYIVDQTERDRIHELIKNELSD